MSVFNGKKLKIEIYGSSHAKKIGVKVKGMPKFAPDMRGLNAFLARRRPCSSVYSTARKEEDVPVFIGIKDGVIKGKFEAYIVNADVKSSDYNELYGVFRPSHADYAWFLKDNVLDFRGGGRFSGRMTAPLCIVGGILKQYLEEKENIKINAFISEVGAAKGASYRDGDFDPERLDVVGNLAFPALSGAEEMLKEITAAKRCRDSVGGRVECVVRGMKTGVGDCLFDGLEGKIASLLYAIPAVKGVEFGAGFSMTAMRGSAANDQMYLDKDNKIRFRSNNSGGINGGISNGNLITFAVAVKPTPSIPRSQETVDFFRTETVKIQIKGRHDACIAPRAVPVVEAATAIAIADEII